jgi:AcrR family transcriptional regulator
MSPAATAAKAPRTRLEPEVRREQILEVARRLFSERTYSEVSTVEIAREAGIARGLLHHHFGSKRDLYLELMRELTRTPPPAPADPDATKARSREEALAEGVELWMRTMEENRGTFLAAAGAEGFGRDREREKILERGRERTAKQVLLLAGLSEEEAGDPQLRAVVRAYSGLAEAATHEWLKRKRLSREQTRILLTDTLLSMLDDVLPKLR